MANRVTSDEVKDIKTVQPANKDVTAWINAANTIVNTLNTKCGTSFDEDTLTQIELYLSAHLLGSIAPQKLTEKFVNYSVGYMLGGNSEVGVLYSSNGRTANMLSGGCLQQLDKVKAVVNFL